MVAEPANDPRMKETALMDQVRFETPCGEDYCELCTPESMTLFSILHQSREPQELKATFASCFGETAMNEAIVRALAERQIEDRSDGLLHMTPLGEQRIYELAELEKGVRG